MSLITGCPACATLFRVVPDQLRISEGWVRCGHCGEVFDATAHLHDESALAAAEGAGQEAGAMAAAPQAGPDREPAGVPALDGSDATAPVDLDVDPQAPPAAAAQESAQEPEGEAPLVSYAFAAVPARELSIEEHGYLPLEALRQEAASSLPPDDDDDRDAERLEPDLPMDDVGFVRQARRKAFWRRPLVRATLALVALALAALLVLQLAWHDRDRLASAHPALVPALAAMCEVGGCRIGPPQRIDAITIDSSGFTRLRTDGYRLSFTLKNAAPHPVAVPSLELTLTDMQDAAVLRRVLTPRELGAPSATLPAGGDWAGSVALAVDTAGGAQRIAGYRLLAFYP